jgi:hypothetical protein
MRGDKPCEGRRSRTGQHFFEEWRAGAMEGGRGGLRNDLEFLRTGLLREDLEEG